MDTCKKSSKKEISYKPSVLELLRQLTPEEFEEAKKEIERIFKRAMIHKVEKPKSS